MGKDNPDTREKGIGVLEEFDGELTRLEKGLESLSVKLEPISTGHDFENKESDIARPEAATELRGRLERLRNLITQFETIQDQIDL